MYVCVCMCMYVYIYIYIYTYIHIHAMHIYNVCMMSHGGRREGGPRRAPDPAWSGPRGVSGATPFCYWLVDLISLLCFSLYCLLCIVVMCMLTVVILVLAFCSEYLGPLLWAPYDFRCCLDLDIYRNLSFSIYTYINMARFDTRQPDLQYWSI